MVDTVFISTKVDSNGKPVLPSSDSSDNLNVNLATQVAGEDLTNDVLKVEHQYSYKYVPTVDANFVVKGAPGFLHAIILGKWVTGGVIEVSDHATDGDGNVKIMLVEGATDESGFPKTIIVDAVFSTGIAADLTGTSCTTFVYR